MTHKELAEAILAALATAAHEGMSAETQIKVLEQIAEAMRLMAT